MKHFCSISTFISLLLVSVTGFHEQSTLMQNYQAALITQNGNRFHNDERSNNSGPGQNKKPATYFVKNGGNDNNSGLSDALAWATVHKVNGFSFKAGDSILFKRGNTWRETLSISQSGSAGGRITYGAYGKGEKPIFDGLREVPGWKTPGNWTIAGTNQWRLQWVTTQTRMRLWLNGVEAKQCGIRYTFKKSSNVTADMPWSWIDNYLYIYSKTNPANTFTGITTPSQSDWLNASEKNYFTLQNLDVRGWYSTGINGCTDFIIENCDWGRNFCLHGIKVRSNGSTYSNNGIIRNCIFDTYDRLWDNWQAQNTEDAINIGTRCSNIEIYRNRFISWGHSSFYVCAADSVYPIKNILFHNNYSTNVGNDYGRALNLDIPKASQCDKNNPIKIYNNLIEDQAVNSQVQGAYVMLYNNIFNRCSGTLSHDTGGKPDAANALCLVNYHGLAQNMKIYNNIFANCKGYGLLIRNDDKSYSDLCDNLIINNIFFNNGGVDRWYDLTGNNHIQMCIDVNTNCYRNTFKNNLFYAASASSPIRYNNRTLTGFLFNALSGNNQDIIQNNITGNPLFVNPANDFHIKETSPAKNNGTDVGLSEDYDGVAWNNPPSIGAFEYKSD
jgi:hypothetical protein